jgi:hypothetical protein
MNDRADCGQIEALAGAVALGEADEAQRETYRRHLAVCAHCVNELGGERDIERVMAAVGSARDDERWEPTLRLPSARRQGFGFAWAIPATVAAALILFVGVRNAETLKTGAQPRPAISAQEARALAALDTQSLPRREGHAESLAVGAPARSTAFELIVDDRGIGLQCTITKGSGNAALDRSLCRAAMQTHYPSHSAKPR